MPKKPKINKRLDNLFKDIQPEDHARGKQAKPKVQKEALPVPSPDSSSESNAVASPTQRDSDSPPAQTISQSKSPIISTPLHTNPKPASSPQPAFTPVKSMKRSIAEDDVLSVLPVESNMICPLPF